MELTEIEKILLEHDIDYEIIYHEVAIKSKQDAAGIFNIEETAPTLILKTDLGFYALIISGEREKIDFKKLKALLGCRKAGLAGKDEIEDQFGIKAGQVPLVGHNLPSIIDNNLLKYEYVYGGIGNWNYTLKIAPKDLLKVNNVILQFD